MPSASRSARSVRVDPVRSAPIREMAAGTSDDADIPPVHSSNRKVAILYDGATDRAVGFAYGPATRSGPSPLTRALPPLVALRPGRGQSSCATSRTAPVPPRASR